MAVKTKTKTSKTARTAKSRTRKGQAPVPVVPVVRILNTTQIDTHLHTANTLISQAMNEISQAYHQLDAGGALTTDRDRDLVSAMRELFQAFHLAGDVRDQLNQTQPTGTTSTSERLAS